MKYQRRLQQHGAPRYDQFSLRAREFSPSSKRNSTMAHEKLIKINTKEVAVNGFAPHGVIEISMDGDVMHYECTGPFNRELFDAMAVAQMAFLANLKHPGPWASIAIGRESVMASLDGIERYAELMKTKLPPELTAVATAFVMGPDVEGSTIMGPHFARIYAEIGRPFKIFPTLTEAIQWAQTMVDASR